LALTGIENSQQGMCDTTQNVRQLKRKRLKQVKVEYISDGDDDSASTSEYTFFAPREYCWLNFGHAIVIQL